MLRRAMMETECKVGMSKALETDLYRDDFCLSAWHWDGTLHGGGAGSAFRELAVHNRGTIVRIMKCLC